jgi:hypothetical protein
MNVRIPENRGITRASIGRYGGSLTGAIISCENPSDDRARDRPD